MGTHYRGTPEAVQALDTYIKLMRAAESVLARTTRHFSTVNLSVSQFAVLESIYHLGPMAQRDLASKLLKSGANITLVVDNLEKRGLVARQRDPTDRRSITVSLTTPGHEMIAGFFPQHVQGIVAEMGALDPAEQVELSRLCRKLGLHER